MKRFSALFLSIALVIISSTDIFARGSSSFGGSRSSSSSYRSSSSSSRSSTSFFSKPATKPAVAPTPATNNTAKVATATVATGAVAATTTTPPKAVATSATSQAMAKQSAVGAKTYTSRAQAESDFKAQQASKYTNSFKTQPATRPEYIPGSISRGGTTYNVTYNNGGYGYYDRGRWSPLDLAMYMVVTDVMLDHNGYGISSQNAALQQQNNLLAQQNAQLAQQNQNLGGTAVVHHGTNSATVFLWIVVVGVGIALIIFFIVKIMA
jgi:hypothetical protein